MVWAVSLFSVTWLWSWPDASPRTCQWGCGIFQPTWGRPHSTGHGQPSAPTFPAESHCLGSGTWVTPRVGMGVLAGAKLWVPVLCCPLPRALRCMCSSGHTWMSSSSAWASSLSACSSLPAWPRWVLPAPAIAFPFPATPRVAQFPLPAHPWALLAPCPLPAPPPACPYKVLVRETEARGELALVKLAAMITVGWAQWQSPSESSPLPAVRGPCGRPAG